MEEQKLRPVLTIRLFTDEKCFGPGIAELLRRVRELKSLRAAAASMGMAYSKAWTIVKTSEKALGFKLLVSTTGGRHGGGASLSTQAENLLAAYEDYCAAVHGFARERFAEAFQEFL